MNDAPEPLRKEAVWAASNFTSGCDMEQMEALVELDFFEAMVSLHVQPRAVVHPQIGGWASFVSSPRGFSAIFFVETILGLMCPKLSWDEWQTSDRCRWARVCPQVQYTETTRVCIPQAIEGIKNALELMPDTGPPLFEALDGFARLAALEEMFHEFAGCHDVYRAIASFQSNS